MNKLKKMQKVKRELLLSIPAIIIVFFLQYYYYNNKIIIPFTIAFGIFLGITIQPIFELERFKDKTKDVFIAYGIGLKAVIYGFITFFIVAWFLKLFNLPYSIILK